MAGLLIEARAAAAAARLAGQSALEPAVLEDLLTRYRALTGAGLTANLYRRTATAKDARRITKLDALRDLFNGHVWRSLAPDPDRARPSAAPRSVSAVGKCRSGARWLQR